MTSELELLRIAISHLKEDIEELQTDHEWCEKMNEAVEKSFISIPKIDLSKPTSLECKMIYHYLNDNANIHSHSNWSQFMYAVDNKITLKPEHCCVVYSIDDLSSVELIKQRLLKFTLLYPFKNIQSDTEVDFSKTFLESDLNTADLANCDQDSLIISNYYINNTKPFLAYANIDLSKKNFNSESIDNNEKQVDITSDIMFSNDDKLLISSHLCLKNKDFKLGNFPTIRVFDGYYHMISVNDTNYTLFYPNNGYSGYTKNEYNTFKSVTTVKNYTVNFLCLATTSTIELNENMYNEN